MTPPAAPPPEVEEKHDETLVQKVIREFDKSHKAEHDTPAPAKAEVKVPHPERDKTIFKGQLASWILLSFLGVSGPIFGAYVMWNLVNGAVLLDSRRHPDSERARTLRFRVFHPRMSRAATKAGHNGMSKYASGEQWVENFMKRPFVAAVVKRSRLARYFMRSGAGAALGGGYVVSKLLWTMAHLSAWRKAGKEQRRFVAHQYYVERSLDPEPEPATPASAAKPGRRGPSEPSPEVGGPTPDLTPPTLEHEPPTAETAIPGTELPETAVTETAIPDAPATKTAAPQPAQWEKIAEEYSASLPQPTPAPEAPPATEAPPTAEVAPAPEASAVPEVAPPAEAAPAPETTPQPEAAAKVGAAQDREARRLASIEKAIREVQDSIRRIEAATDRSTPASKLGGSEADLKGVAASEAAPKSRTTSTTSAARVVTRNQAPKGAEPGVSL